MSKKSAIMDAVYAKATSMTVQNGYTYGWGTLRSVGNGTLASIGVSSPVFSCVWNRDDESAPDAGQSLYHMNGSFTITGYVKTDPKVALSEQDYEAEKIKSAMESDILKAFGFVSTAMCQAGVQYIEYSGEVDIEDIDIDLTMTAHKFKIMWFENRS